jgi:hypothetical protein
MARRIVKAGVVTPDLMVYDKSLNREFFPNVKLFAEKMIPGCPLGKTVYLTLAFHRRSRARFPVSVSTIQSGDGWLHVKVRVSHFAAFPCATQVKTKTTAVGDKVAQVLMNARFTYDFDDVTFSNAEEAAIFGAGNGLFWALRKLNRIEGRNSKTARNLHGLMWLSSFRFWLAKGRDDAAIVPEKIVDRRALCLK